MKKFSSSQLLLTMLEDNQSKLTNVWNMATLFTNQSLPMESRNSSSIDSSTSLPVQSITNDVSAPSIPISGTSSVDVGESSSPLSPTSSTSFSVAQLQQENNQLRQDRADLQRLLTHCLSRASKNRQTGVQGQDTPTKINSGKVFTTTSTSTAVSVFSPGRLDTMDSSYCTDLDGQVTASEKHKVSSKEIFLVLRGEIKRSQNASAELDTRLKSALLKLQECRVESLQVLPLRLQLRELTKSHAQALEAISMKYHTKEEECTQLIEANKLLSANEFSLTQALAEEKKQLSLTLNKIEFLLFHVEELSNKLASTDLSLSHYRHDNLYLSCRLQRTEEALSVCTLEKGHLERRTSSLSKEVVRMQELCNEFKVSEPEDIIKHVRSLEAKCTSLGMGMGGVSRRVTDVTCRSETVSTAGDFSLESAHSVTMTPSPVTHVTVRDSRSASASGEYRNGTQQHFTQNHDFSDGSGCFPPILFLCGWNHESSRNKANNKRKSVK